MVLKCISSYTKKNLTLFVSKQLLIYLNVTQSIVKIHLSMFNNACLKMINLHFYFNNSVKYNLIVELVITQRYKTT